MEFKKGRLETVKNALQYAVIGAKSLPEETEFALLLLDVQSAIDYEKENEKHIKKITVKSIEGCPFHYCDSNPTCDGQCRYTSS